MSNEIPYISLFRGAWSTPNRYWAIACSLSLIGSFLSTAPSGICGEALTRRKIAYINRQLKEEGRKYSLRDMVLPEGGRLALPKSLGLDDLAVLVKKIARESAAEENGAPADEEALKLGSLDAGLKGGQFSTYSLSRYGLDAGKSLGKDLGLIILLKPEEGRPETVPAGAGAASPAPAARGASFAGSERLNAPVRSVLPAAFQEQQRRQIQDGFEGSGGLLTGTGAKGAGMLFGNFNFEGMRASVSNGPFKLDLLNWRREPKREKKEFFGNNGTTYLLGIPSMFPGTEKVYLNGRQLSAAEYTLDTARGELRLSAPATTSDRLSLDYDLIGTQDAQPGQFTGIRLGGELNGSPLGMSLLSQQIIGFERNVMGEVEKKVREQRLTGFDGSFKLAGQTITVETATSTGDRKRSAGTISTATFLTTDTLDPSGSTDGPYQLPEAQLPVVEGSAQIFVDGFAVPGGHYVLDHRAGRLSFQKGVIRFNGTERIEVRYRVQNDVTGPGGSPRLTGGANKFGITGGFPPREETTARADAAGTGYLGGGQPKAPPKGLSYGLSTETTDANFFTMGAGGSGAAGKSRKTKQHYEYGVNDGHFLKFSRDTSSQLLDEVTGLQGETTAEAFAWHFSGSKVMLTLKRDNTSQTGATNTGTTRLDTQGKFLAGADLSLGFLWKDEEQSAGGRRTERFARELSAIYQPHGRLNAALRFGHEEHTDTAPGAKSADGALASLSLTLKPMQTLSLALERGRTPSAGNIEKLAMKYQPGQWLDLDILHEAGEAATLGQGLEQKAVSGTRQRRQTLKLGSKPFKTGRLKSIDLAYQMNAEDISDPTGGNRTNDHAQLSLRFAPRPALTLNWLTQWRDQAEPATGSGNTLETITGNLRLLRRWGLDLNRTEVDQTSGASEVQSRQWSLAVKVPRQHFLRELDIQIKRDGQRTDSGVLTALGKTLSRQIQDGAQLQFQARPFWKDRLFMLSLISRATRITGQAATKDGTLRAMLELPFVGESHLELTHERTQRKQTAGKAKDLSYEALLKGAVSQKLNLAGGYRAKNSTDVTGLDRMEEQWSVEGDVAW